MPPSSRRFPYGSAESPPSWAVVVPTVGRASLRELLEALAAGPGPAPAEVVVVDDRPGGGRDPLPVDGFALAPLRVVRSGGKGPAAARNAGWRRVLAEWVVFLDDDVVPRPGWRSALAADLLAAGADVVGVQGRVEVPLPATRRPTDRERGTAGLAGSRWITADMAYRRAVLARVGGFEERFPRAYREDADLGLRASRLGAIASGSRVVAHPVRPASWWASVAAQAGNADDALLAAIHGRGWRVAAGAPRGRLAHTRAHTGSPQAALSLAPAGRRRDRRRGRGGVAGRLVGAGAGAHPAGAPHPGRGRRHARHQPRHPTGGGGLVARGAGSGPPPPA